MMNNYVAYHTHSDLSLLDSCTSYKEYIDEAAKEGMTAISISEHGRPSNWVSKKLYAESKGLKYIHSCEIYLTESLEEKVRDNYHCVALCKNFDGVLELNDLISKGGTEEQFYYVPRITFEQFINMSDNIITTSACLASALNKLDENNPWYEKLVRKFTYLEVQPHMNLDQKRYNRKLVEISEKYGKNLIAGVDAHSLNEYKAQCRDILLVAKHKYYPDEGFDLTWKTYDELVDAFKRQDVLTEKKYIEAIENTNRMAEMVENFELNTEFKYPILYGSREEDSKEFAKTVERMFEEKISAGIIPKDQEPAFRKAIDEEMAVFEKLGMTGFMGSMSDIMTWCKNQGMAIGPARGSVAGSRVAYITDIIDVNPEQWKTNFYRFANPDRLEPGDIDIDCIEEDRPKIFAHIVEKFGTEKTARVAAYGTLQDKAVIDEIGRALDITFKVNMIRQRTSELTYQQINNRTSLDTLFEKYFPGEKSPWSLKTISQIKSEYEKDQESARLAYKELFYYFDGLLGTKISQSVHPAGMIISSVTLDDNCCTFIKDGERCLVLDMEDAHEYGLIKYDLLLLKTVKVINDTCKLIGIPYPKTYQVDFNDEKVWDDMVTSPVGLFQMEGSFAFDSLRKFKPRSVEDVTLVTAAIRPSGASYRDRLLARKPETGWPDEINELLKENLYYLVYQEDVLNILMYACGLSGGEADTVRRGIAKKKEDIIEAAMPRVLEGYCSHSNKPKEEAEAEAKNLIQVIEDASAYMFGYNHATAYSILTYYCGYFRHYYPLEFLTAFLNNAANDEDIINGTEYARRVGINITMPKWGISRGEYYFDNEKKVISKGLSSIKYMGDKVAMELYDLAHSKEHKNFMSILKDISTSTEIDSRQLDILIKIDFFSEFGNQRELLYITELFMNMFKKGDAKKIKKDKVDDSTLGEIIKKHSVGVTKSGEEAASYTIIDMDAILDEAEEAVYDAKLEDLSVIEKVRNFYDVMGYMGYVSGEAKDRPKLLVNDIKPLLRKKDGKQFGYSFFTTSIGSGISSRFTVMNRMFNLIPVKKNDIIYCKHYSNDNGYYRMDLYEKIS